MVIERKVVELCRYYNPNYFCDLHEKKFRML